MELTPGIRVEIIVLHLALHYLLDGFFQSLGEAVMVQAVMVQIGQTQKVSIGTDEAFELPPNFLDRVEFMAAVGRQINQIDARLRGQPYEESLA